MNRKPVHEAIPVRMTPVAAAVAASLGSLPGTSIAENHTGKVGLTSADELVVTATRRDESVQDVPYNISAISGDEIEKLQIRDLSDIARWTPGLVQVDQGGRDANLLIMRGLNVSPIAAPELLRNTQGGRVSTYYGEVPVYIDLKPIDIDRVEVLRGPQGTLYGARSLGGTLRYIPNSPEMNTLSVDAYGRMYGMDESDDMGYDGNIVANLPLVQDKLAFRAMLGYFNKPGFIDQNYLVNEPGVSCPEPFFSDPGCTPDDLVSKKDVNDERTTTARFALLWNIADNFSAEVSWQHQDQEFGGRQAQTVDSMAVIETPANEPLITSNYENGFRFEEPNDRENNIYNLTLTYEADRFEVLSTTSYTTYDDTGQRDQTDLLLLYGYGFFPAFSAYTLDQTNDDFITQEVRFVSKDTGRWDWVGGVYYQKGDLQQGSREFAPGFTTFDGFPEPDDVVTVISVDRETTELALFGELGYMITDKWHVLGGARWFTVDDDITNCAAFYFDGFAGGCDQGDGDGNDTLFKLSTDYRFTDDLLGYALFSQGISLGGVNPGAFIPPEDRFIDPESVDNYEVGLRSSWFDDRLIVNGAVFYMDWTDIQLDGTSSNALPITSNGGGAESTGLELESRINISDNWVVGVGYAYTNAKLTDSCLGPADWDNPNKSCPINGVVTEDGDRLPGSPQHQGNLLVGYNHVFGNGLGFSANWRVTVQDEVFTKLGDGDDCCRNNGEALGGFSVHSATLSLSGENWQATLFSDNIFNKYAETGVRDDVTFIGREPDGAGNDFALRRYFKNVITPRTVGVDFRYRFGGE